jgi:hypothetical protein
VSYAYVHARPDGTIFYVGKGVGRRMREMSPGRRNKHHGRIVAKYGKRNILMGYLECSSDVVAFELETGLIKCLRRMGVELSNQTEGGSGGTNITAEIRDVHRVNTTERWKDTVYAARVIQAICAAMTPEECALKSERAKKLWTDPEYRTKSIEVRKGHAWNKGYVCTPEQVLNRKKAARMSNMKRNYGTGWRSEYLRRYPEHVGDVDD